MKESGGDNGIPPVKKEKKEGVAMDDAISKMVTFVEALETKVYLRYHTFMYTMICRCHLRVEREKQRSKEWSSCVLLSVFSLLPCVHFIYRFATLPIVPFRISWRSSTIMSEHLALVANSEKKRILNN